MTNCQIIVRTILAEAGTGFMTCSAAATALIFLAKLWRNTALDLTATGKDTEGFNAGAIIVSCLASILIAFAVMHYLPNLINPPGYAPAACIQQ